MDLSVDFDACEERCEYYQRRYPSFGIILDDVKYPRNDKNELGKWKYGLLDISGDCFFILMKRR